LRNLFYCILILFCVLTSSISHAGEPSEKFSQALVIKQIKDLLNSEGLNFESSGMIVRDITDEKSIDIYNHQADKLFNTASVMKIFTTAAALEILKPEYRFSTYFYSDSEIKNGVINGNLYIKAGADPFFVPEEMTRLINEFVLLGVQKITGNIVIDTSIHNDADRPAGWNPEKFSHAYSAKISPLTYSFNSISVRIVCGNNGKPEVFYSPAVSGIKVKNNAKIIRKGKETFSIEVKPDGNNEVIVLNGTVRRNKSFTKYLSINEPEKYFARALTDAFKQNSIAFRGKIKFGNVKKNPVLILEHKSLPLSTLVASINQYSNNIMAELLLRHIGHVQYEEPGNSKNGIKAVSSFLDSQNLNSSELQQKDGSGLTPDSLASPRLIASLLANMSKRFDIGPEFMSSLSSTGGMGTLSKHLQEQPYYRHIRGKTGFVNGTIAVAGYVKTVKNRHLVFCLLLNDVNRSYRDVWDTIIDEILKQLVQL